MKSYIANIRRIYNPIELVLQLGALFVLNAWLFNFVSMNYKASLVVGAVCAFYFFHVFSYKMRKLQAYQDDLNNIMKYVTNVTFFLQLGENVYKALVLTRATLSAELQRSVDITIDALERDAVLVVDHYAKYNFPAVEQFHQNLNIKYNEGGDPTELFSTIQTSMINELKKRDELYRKRKGLAVNVYAMLGMVGGTTVILRTMTTNLWEIFLSYGTVSLIILCITYLFIMLNLYFLQCKVVDIAVQK